MGVFFMAIWGVDTLFYLKHGLIGGSIRLAPIENGTQKMKANYLRQNGR